MEQMFHVKHFETKHPEWDIPYESFRMGRSK